MNLDHSWMAMIMAAVRDKLPKLPPAAPLSWITWAHVATTVTILIFLWTQYQQYSSENADDVRRLAVLTAQVESLRAIEDQWHFGMDKRLDEMDKRLDVQRADIREAQTQLNAHIDRINNGNGR